MSDMGTEKDRIEANEDARLIVEFERAIDAWASVRHNTPPNSVRARALKEARQDTLLALLARMHRLRQNVTPEPSPPTPLQEETFLIFRQNGLEVS